jgi:hypothetical protein
MGQAIARIDLVKNDPKLVAAARELRDKWLERITTHPDALVSHGKHEVSRRLQRTGPKPPALLDAA